MSSLLANAVFGMRSPIAAVASLVLVVVGVTDRARWLG
jgi:hypothetical protein